MRQATQFGQAQFVRRCIHADRRRRPRARRGPRGRVLRPLQDGPRDRPARSSRPAPVRDLAQRRARDQAADARARAAGRARHGHAPGRVAGAGVRRPRRRPQDTSPPCARRTGHLLRRGPEPAALHRGARRGGGWTTAEREAGDRAGDEPHGCHRCGAEESRGGVCEPASGTRRRWYDIVEEQQGAPS